MPITRCPDCGAGVVRLRGRTPTTVVDPDGAVVWRGLARQHECANAGCARVLVEETADARTPAPRT